MQSLEVPRLLAALAELIEKLEAFPFEHQDVRVAVVGDVEKLLLLVGRERQAGSRLRRRSGSIDEGLRHVLPIRREDLHSPVGTIGNVNQAVVRDFDGVHWSTELLRPGTLGVESRSGATAGCISAGGVRTAPGTSRGSAARRGRHIDGR